MQFDETGLHRQVVHHLLQRFGAEGDQAVEQGVIQAAALDQFEVSRGEDSGFAVGGSGRSTGGAQALAHALGHAQQRLADRVIRDASVAAHHATGRHPPGVRCADQTRLDGQAGGHQGLQLFVHVFRLCCFAALNFSLEAWRLTTFDREVGTHELAVFHVQKSAVCFTRLAQAQQRQDTAFGQGGGVHAQHMGDRLQAIQAPTAKRVGDHAVAVFQVEAHTGHTLLLVFLRAIAVAIGPDLANRKPLVAEYATAHPQLGLGHIGSQAQRRRARQARGHRAVDRVRVVHDTHANAQSVAQAHVALVGQARAACIKAQAGAAGGLVELLHRVSNGSAVHHGRAFDVGEPRRQNIVKVEAADGRTRAVGQDQLKVHLVAHLGLGLAGLLAQQQGRALADGVQWDVVVQDWANRRRGTGFVTGADVFVPGGGLAARGDLHVGHDKAAAAINTGLRRNGFAGGVGGRRCHVQAVVADIGHRRDLPEELVLAICTGEHADRAIGVEGVTAAAHHFGRVDLGHDAAITGQSAQGDQSALDWLTGHRVVHMALWVDQQT